MGIGGIWQWVVVLLIVALIFGTKKLRNMGSDLGEAVHGFRKGVRGKEAKGNLEAESETKVASDSKNKTTS